MKGSACFLQARPRRRDRRLWFIGMTSPSACSKLVWKLDLKPRSACTSTRTLMARPHSPHTSAGFRVNMAHCFHAGLDRLLTCVQIEEMGPGPTLIGHPAVRADYIQAFGRGPIGFVNGIVNLFDEDGKMMRRNS